MESISISAKPVQVEICEHPIFIIGSPRSGTSILAGALAQHSTLWTSDETQILWDLFYDGRVDINYQRELRNEKSWLREQGVEREEFLSFLGLGLNALITSRSNGNRWIDHTPIYTLIADTVAELFPGAFFLHILRDARKVVNSMVNYKNIYTGDLAHLHWALDFGDACRTWVHYVEMAMAFSRSHPSRCLTVSNEALIASAEEEFQKIFDFIRVDFEDDPIAFVKSNRWNSSYLESRSDELAQNMYSRPSSHWTIEQREVFVQEVVPTLRKYSLATEAELALLI